MPTPQPQPVQDQQHPHPSGVVPAVTYHQQPPPVQTVPAEAPQPVRWIEVEGKVDQAQHGQVPRYAPEWVRWSEVHAISGIVDRIRRWPVSSDDKYPLTDGRDEYLTYDVRDPRTG